MMLALCFAALQAVAPPQAEPPEPKTALDLAMAAHLGVARAERELEFFERYAAAGAEARARARSVLERLRAPGAPSGAPSTVFAVAKATRALEAPPADASAAASLARERLLELVDALDVQCTPGMFAAGTPTEGGAVRVVVYPLYVPPERLAATLSLWWTRPDGKELLAHRGTARPETFDPQGFSLDVAAPGSAPGTWKLAVELERESVRVRGAPLEIQSVPGLAERSHAAFDALADPADPRQALARWIALASQRGLRTLAGVRVEDQLARLESAAPGQAPHPWLQAFRAEDGEAHWLWRRDPAAPARVNFLLLCPSTEPPEAALSRADWALPGARVLASHLPRGGATEGSMKDFFARLAAALEREGAGGVPLVCVERGDALGRLAMGFHGASGRPFDAEVLSLASAPASEEGLAGAVPRLVLAPGGRAQLGELAPGTRTAWLDASPISLIADFELPHRLRDSLPWLLPARVDGRQDEK